jgi:hypothetical protein
VGTGTSLMDKTGIKKVKHDGAGRFDLTATSVPKGSVGLPPGVNEVAVKTSDFKMSGTSEGTQSLGMGGVKNITAIYLNVQSEIAPYGRAPIGFKLEDG